MHFFRLPLLWRVFAVNAGLLVLAVLLLLFTPIRMSRLSNALSSKAKAVSATRGLQGSSSTRLR